MKRSAVIIVLIIPLLCLSACVAGGNTVASATPSSTVTPSASPTASVTPTPTPSPTPNAKPSPTVLYTEPTSSPKQYTSQTASPLAPSTVSKGLIYDQFAREGTYTDELKNAYKFYYHVPAINLNSKDASEMNADISTYCMGYINQGMTVTDASWFAYENGNVVSVVIRLYFQNNTFRYKPYNIDKITGNKISDSDLLAIKGINEDKYLNTAQKLMIAKFFSSNGNKDIWRNDAFYDEQYNKTVSSNNIYMNMPMFLDDDGTICIIARIYSMAGADAYYFILDTGL